MVDKICVFHVEKNGTIGTKHKNRHKLDKANQSNKPASQTASNTASNNSDKQTTSIKTTCSKPPAQTETKINYTECVNIFVQIAFE